MKTFNTFKITVLGLLILSFLSAMLMLPVFLRNSEMRTRYLLDAARAYVRDNEVDYPKAVSDDIRIVAYVQGQSGGIIPDFGFSSPDAILADLNKLPLGENLVKRDDRGIPYMLAKTYEGFAATILYPDVYIFIASLIINFLILASAFAILWRMYKRVTRSLSDISRNLRDFSENEPEAWFKNVSNREYPLREMKELAERICDFLRNYKNIKLNIDKFEANRRKMLELSVHYLEKGQRVAAEFTRLRDENSNVDFHLVECDWDDFDALTDTAQSRIAALLKEAAEYAVKRNADEIYVSLQDEENGMMIFEIRDDGDGFNESSMPEPMKALIKESEGFDINVDSQEEALGCVLKVTF